RGLRAWPAHDLANAPCLRDRATVRPDAPVTRTDESLRATPRPGLPVQPLRAVAVPPARDLRDHADDGRRPTGVRPSGHPPRHRPAGAGGRRRTVARHFARPGARALAGNEQLRVL